MSAVSDGEAALDAEEQRVRQSYLCRLGIRASVIKEEDDHEARRKSAPSVTLILLDWDDTLFFTSARGGTLSQTVIASFDASASRFLQECCRLGETLVITNADEGWVERCVEPLPKLRQTLARVRVISAREKHGRKHPGNPVLWKCNTFAELKENSRQIANLVAVGDQEPEMRAVAHLAKLYHTSFVKTVRLVSAPNVLELQMQLDTLTPRIATIVAQARHMSITLQRVLSGDGSTDRGRRRGASLEPQSTPGSSKEPSTDGTSSSEDSP